jgi:DNA polymerase-3 subunit delta
MDLARGQSVEQALKASDKILLVLLYGPDSGLAHERALGILKSVGADPGDAFRVSRFAASTLNDDPARLPDEAASLSFTGERRVVWITDVSDSAGGKAIAAYLAEPVGEALIVAEAGDLPSKSALRTAAKGSAVALSAPCYLDGASDIGGVIRAGLSSAGLTASPDALRYLTEHLGSDRLISRAEIDKLALYAAGKGRVELEDALASVGDNAAQSAQDVVQAASSGNLATLDHLIARAFQDGESSVGLIRVALRHFQRLQIIAAYREKGLPPKEAVDKLQPRAFWQEAERLARDTLNWPAPAASAALKRLLEAEIQCKTTALPDQTMASRALFEVAAMAKRNR